MSIIFRKSLLDRRTDRHHSSLMRFLKKDLNSIGSVTKKHRYSDRLKVCNHASCYVIYSHPGELFR
jgi:hypothetical protein